ncbi:hypothetical protein ABZ738_31425 [Micromonospora sp. NPDC047793]|uniref:hypothetical protein n=1 Tax=Micromonospora sp. NPDC047793 TaxID=3154342 RepID=UPI0033F41C52
MSYGEPCPPHPGTISVDRYGLPYINLPRGLMNLSPCCFAAVTIFTDESLPNCKNSYNRARSVIAIDFDGVLNPDHPPTARQLGHHRHHYDGPDPTGQRVSGEAWLHPDHGP